MPYQQFALQSAVNAACNESLYVQATNIISTLIILTI